VAKVPGKLPNIFATWLELSAIVVSLEIPGIVVSLEIPGFPDFFS